MDGDLAWERQLENWGRWRGGTSVSSALAPARIYFAGVVRGEKSDGIPIINGEALDIDQAWQILNAQDVRLARAIQLRYVWPEYAETTWAHRCGVSVRTFYRRLADGKLRLRSIYLAQCEKRRAAAA